VGQKTGSFRRQATMGGSLTLLPPVDYLPFMYLMTQSYLGLTDAGGLQEEA